MSFGTAQGRERVGRPTQFHGVPVEERAFDSAGNRLPWALEYPDGHPNARARRQQPEEKGSFGRSARRNRTGSTRGVTRTQTPATREANSSLRGFETALRFDHERAPPAAQQAQQTEVSATVGDSVPTTTAKAQAPPDDAEPTQIILSGFATDSQWSAISFYENASGGMICEEYDREPPDERKRWHGGGLISNGGSTGLRRARRALTAQEAKLSMQYRGGAHWIRVTFDSRAAAERAIAASPHIIQGHWVHAELWKSKGPETDAPEPVTEEDELQNGRLSAPKPAKRGLGRSMSGGLTSPTTPTSPSLGGLSGRFGMQIEDSPQSSQTATSSTATGPESAADGELRRRSIGGAAVVDEEEELTASQLANSLGRFPQQSRMVIKPATQALLPSKTVLERLWKWLTDVGLMPKDVIGSTVPRKDGGMGEFDWENASYYWMICKWLDETLGTDICCMKDQ